MRLYFNEEMGEAMCDSKNENSILKVLQEVHAKLKAIELDCTDFGTKEKIHKLINYIEEENLNSKKVLAEMIYAKVKETRSVSSELNTYFYLLYRNLEQGKVSVEEAHKLYDMYVKELIY